MKSDPSAFHLRSRTKIHHSFVARKLGPLPFNVGANKLRAVLRKAFLGYIKTPGLWGVSELPCPAHTAQIVRQRPAKEGRQRSPNLWPGPPGIGGIASDTDRTAFFQRAGTGLREFTVGELTYHNLPLKQHANVSWDLCSCLPSTAESSRYSHLLHNEVPLIRFIPARPVRGWIRSRSRAPMGCRDSRTDHP